MSSSTSRERVRLHRREPRPSTRERPVRRGHRGHDDQPLPQKTSSLLILLNIIFVGVPPLSLSGLIETVAAAAAVASRRSASPQSPDARPPRRFASCLSFSHSIIRTRSGYLSLYLSFLPLSFSLSVKREIPFVYNVSYVVSAPLFASRCALLCGNQRTLLIMS